MELPDSPASAPRADAVAAPVADLAPDALISPNASSDDGEPLVQPSRSDSAVPPPSRPATRAPRSPSDAALDNARRGRWVMTDSFDGWMLLGDDDKPVMRADRSRVGFRFRDAARLSGELAASPDAADPVPLAPLDSGYNRDWDPQVMKSRLATRTKLVRLLAYKYAQTTEPEEAVRHAITDIFENPTMIEEPRIYAWVPGHYDLDAVKAAAAALLRRAIGPEAEGEGADALVDMPGADVAPLDQANSTDGEMRIAQAGQPGAQQLQPARGERHPPGAYRDKQKTNIQPSPPTVQPEAVIRALENNHLTKAWREKLAEYETQGNPYDGYGTYLFQEKGFAYGRYQFRVPGLKDAGMMDMKTGEWTGKYGVNSWRDFMNNPQAQEAALKDWTQKIETNYMRQHLPNMGRTIMSAEGEITITPSGFIGACHQAGTTRMNDYFRWAEANNWDTRGKPMPHEGFKEIERRMKGFENIPHR